MSGRDETLRAAQGYISRDWPTFILSSSKTPVANCDRCRAEAPAIPGTDGGVQLPRMPRLLFGDARPGTA